MANTYTQINIHCVFAVKGRENILHSKLREDLFKYLSGILKNENAFPLAVNGWKDHVHLFFELPPNQSVSDLIRVLKSSSSKWINENHFTVGHFSWQEGYGAFSYSKSQKSQVINYISNQELHHSTKSFKQEYLELLNSFKIEFNENMFLIFMIEIFCNYF